MNSSTTLDARRARSRLIPPASRTSVYIIRVLAIAAVYTGAGNLGLDLAFATRSVTAIWPPTGIALAALILGGYRLWPAVALGALVTNLDTGVPAVTVLGITCGNTLEALAGGGRTPPSASDHPNRPAQATGDGSTAPSPASDSNR
jgi:integral membrane sensor domain MASE1